jgi:glycosyltransferase involved in cell wall biosynthesis
MQPKVSVIVPVYNVEPYLRRCLNSLVNQTLENIEIICINDCSLDESLVILKKYAKKDNRITIIDFKKNQGVSVARNAGMKIAKGEYIGFCDPDDYVDLDFYEKLHDKAKETNADMVKASLKKKKVEWVKEYSYFASVEKSKHYDIFYHWCYIYKTDFLEKNKINYPEGVKFSEDALLLVKSLFCSNRIETVDNTFYHYIMRECDAATSYIGDAIANSYGMPLVFDFMNKAAKDENEYKFFFNFLFVNHILKFFARVAPEYRKIFVGIAIDIYRNRRDSVIIEKMPKFLNECDLENTDILFEKLNDNLNFLQYPKIQIDNLQNRKFYIWGAGANGVDALAQCDNNGWKVEAFLDSNSQIKEYQGYGILHPQHLLDSKSKDFFIVISSRDYAEEIAEICKRAGLREGMDFWKPC